MNSIWTPMVNVLQPVSVGVAKVDHFEVGRSESILSHIRRESVNEGRYARLYVNGHLMMTDTDMEKRTNRHVIHASEGDVLIAGLGLGMIVLPIAKKEIVTSITVIEKYQDVVDSVLPSLHIALNEVAAKVTVICADIYDWKPALGEKFDCIYFDIWPGIYTDNLPQMAKLHQKFKCRLKGKRWMDSWCKEQLKSRKRQEDKWNRRCR